MTDHHPNWYYGPEAQEWRNQNWLYRRQRTYEMKMIEVECHNKLCTNTFTRNRDNKNPLYCSEECRIKTGKRRWAKRQLEKRKIEKQNKVWMMPSDYDFIKNMRPFKVMRGIYMLRYKNNVQYIGKSENLGHRCYHYEKYSIWKDDGFWYTEKKFFWDELVCNQSKEDLLALEAKLVRYFKPPFNIHHNN